MKEQVQKILDQIRPQLQADGGDVALVDVVDGIVKVKLQGACARLSHVSLTLRMALKESSSRSFPQ